VRGDFSERYGPWAVVAGASDGIGASGARLLGAQGVNVVLVARRRAVLEDVAATIPSESRTLVLDLSTPKAATELAEATADLPVGLFVYNAGADPNASQFLEKPVAVWNDMVVRNCTTIVGTTHHFAALMRQRGHGGIVVVTSGAAWAGGSHLAVYAASKAFDLVLAESLWAELSPAGVDVLGMVLGPTDTPAFRKVLNGRQLDGLADPDDVARDMLDNLANGPTFPPDPTPFSAIPRRQAVELMSQGSSAITGS
jgi:short-subunit dehydrogenase